MDVDDFGRRVNPEPADEEFVHVLVIDHRQGTNVHVHRTEAGARLILRTFVNEWWEDELGDIPMPEDDDEAITEYFMKANGESYTLQRAAIEG